VDYPQDPDVSYDITRRGYHGKEVETASVSVNDSHRKEWKRIRSIPMPTTVERAVDAFYIKFRQEYNGAGKTEISGSNRSKFDALDAARAKLLLNQIFYGSTPKIATEEYALYGILYALESRLQETNQAAVEKSMGEIKAWVEENFPKILKAEEDAWWCQAHKKIAEYKNQIPELAGFYAAEITSYQSDVRRAIPAFRKVKAAYENKEDRRAQLAKVEYPFMNYLFQEQPNLPRVSEGQLKEIMTCLLKSFETASCKIDMAVGEAANAADLNKYVGRV
jgi:hypothetical protein